jgi:flagellum-specific peptidoglycan hydrolase FlgJ
MIRKRTLLMTLLISIFLFANIGAKFPVMSESKNVSSSFEMGTPESLKYPVLVRQRLHGELVSEVKEYITKMAPKSKVSAEVLVTLCQKHEVDVTFVLAQGLIESHFGTKGMATQTNSVFNVGTWDSKKVLYKYKTQNESIEPYLILLKKDYLSKRTLRQLLNDGGYKNINGHRYAVSPSYEQSLRTTITNITMETSIKMYQDVMNLSDESILAYFGTDSTISLGDPKTLTASLN